MDLNSWVRIKLSRPSRRLTIRLLYLERYLDQSKEYHEDVATLLQRLAADGLLPEGTVIPTPPVIPEYEPPDC
jgi:hypothetical protein